MRFLNNMRVLRFLEALVVLALLAMAAAVLLSGKAYAEDATVAWTHPTQRENNVALALAEIRETQVDWGLCSGGTFPATPAGTKAVPAPATTTTITALGYGTWCFRARTVDTGGLTSVNTSVVQKVILAPPKPPVLSSTVTVAYELLPDKWDGVRLGREVGIIPLGSACLGEPLQTQKGEVYRLAGDVEVRLTKVPKPGTLGLVTRCAWKAG